MCIYMYTIISMISLIAVFICIENTKVNVLRMHDVKFRVILRIYY